MAPIVRGGAKWEMEIQIYNSEVNKPYTYVISLFIVS